MGSAEECQAAEEFSRTCQLLQEVCREFLKDSKAHDGVVVQGQAVHLVTGLLGSFLGVEAQIDDSSDPYEVSPYDQSNTSITENPIAFSVRGLTNGLFSLTVLV